MNRRVFVKTSAIAAAVVALPVTLTSCVSVKSLLNTVIGAVQAILRVADPTATWSVTLQAALTALVQAEANWTAGGAVVIVIDALNTLANVCAVIPMTAVYSPLIDILVAGIDAVLTLLIPKNAVVALVKPAANPHRGRVQLNKPHFYQTQQGAFHSQWNRAADGIGLKAAKI